MILLPVAISRIIAPPATPRDAIVPVQCPIVDARYRFEEIPGMAFLDVVPAEFEALGAGTAEELAAVAYASPSAHRLSASSAIRSSRR
jgi:hypothetical protein